MSEPVEIAFTLNGRPIVLRVPPRRRLLDLLREDLRLTGAKEGCGKGECGTCTVLVDGRPVASCLMLAVQADGAVVETIEGLSRSGSLHPLQRAVVETGGSQCGACIPGMIMAGKALLDATPRPGAGQVQQALSGNLCRCTGYTKIVEAVLCAAPRHPAPAAPVRVAGRAPASVRPRSLDDLLALLDSQPRPRLIAGGTDLLVRSRDGGGDPPRLVDITAVPELAGIEQSQDCLRIGAICTHTEIATSPAVAAALPALAQACAAIGGPQVRNRGTLGGNLANASPAADTLPPLYVADAQVELAGPGSRRQVPIDELFSGPGTSLLLPGELILAVRIPRREGLRSAFLRLAQRRAQAISKVAVSVALIGDRVRIERARVAFGAVAPTVIRARRVESILEEGGVERLGDAMEAARSEVRPIDDIRSSREYRREMAAVLLRRAVASVCSFPPGTR